MTFESPAVSEAPSLVIYDGDCLFCQNYVRFMRLRRMVGEVELLDARSDDPRVGDYWRRGYDLNQGMLFVHRGCVYFGHEAVSVLASLSSRSDLFNRLNRKLLSNERLARRIYPILKLGRRATLFVRRKPLLEDLR